MLFLCYQLAIRKTLAIRAQYEQLSDMSINVQDTPLKLILLKQKEHYIDSMLSKMNLGSSSNQNNLLSSLNTLSDKNKLRILKFNQPHVYTTSTNSLITYSFVLTGDFTNILKTIYTIEQNGTFGEVVHVEFEKKMNYRSHKNLLEGTVMIQQVN